MDDFRAIADDVEAKLGRFDVIRVNETDPTFSLSFMSMVLLLITFIQPNIWIITLIVAVFLWEMPARVVLSVRSALRKSPHASGASDLRTMFIHVTPNVLPIAFLYTAYGVAWSVAAKARLSSSQSGLGTGTSFLYLSKHP